MKKKVPQQILDNYKLPSFLTDFQLEMFIHLIDWKWSHLTREMGKFGDEYYDAILPESFQQNWHPIYQPMVSEIKNLRFKKHKHFGHMASSQAACLNLFYPLLRDKRIADLVFPQMKPDFRELAVNELDKGFRFEYYDLSNPLNDHTPIAGTDADVAIAYYNNIGELSLWLIEHKLTEDEFTTCGGYRVRKKKEKQYCRNGKLILSDHNYCHYASKCNYNYWEITDRSELYDYVALGKCKHCPFKGGENQLWRNQLLGNAIRDLGHFKNVHFSVIRHPNNHDLDKTLESYVKFLKTKEVLSCHTSKELIDKAGSVNNPDLNIWSSWYSELYRI
jgi:hypothetical protein